MEKNKPKKIIRIILVVLSVALTAILALLLWDVFRVLLTEEGRELFRARILDMGAWGYFALIGLNASQIFLFFLPGEPIELLAGMCYGAVGGLLVTYIGTFLSSLVIFFLIRKVGKTSVYDFFSEKTVHKIEKNAFLQSGKAEGLLLLLFVIPGTPKDLLVYIGALMPTKALRFIALSTLFRFPGIITSTLVGASVADGNWYFAAAVYGVTLIGSVLLLRHLSKKEKVKEILDVGKDESA